LIIKNLIENGLNYLLDLGWFKRNTKRFNIFEIIIVIKWNRKIWIEARRNKIEKWQIALYTLTSIKLLINRNLRNKQLEKILKEYRRLR
jgi:hypothetical protein